MEIQPCVRSPFGGPSSAFAGTNFFSGDKGAVIDQEPSERIKRRLLEVFSVRICDEDTVSEGELIHGFGVLGPSGGPCNAVLFSRKAQDLPIVNKSGFMKLNGPMGAVEVNDEVAFHAYMWVLFPAGFNEGYANTLWTAGVDETDQLICKEVKSEYGPLELYFAVYNNAVKAHLEVAVDNWGVHEGFEAFGTVDAGSSNIPDIKARSRLFDRSIDKAVCVRPDIDGTKLPLFRSVTVVPLGSNLLVDVMIWRLKNSCRDQQPIFEKLSFDAALTGTEMKVASANWGNVKVTVTWSG